jgi:23S rRNA (adenine-N6)-dimethyltransferase
VAARPRQLRGRGQHFLRSSNLAAELVGAAGIGPGDLVLDLGAGTGALTTALAKRGARVHAVEIDPELAAGLRRRLPNVSVTEGSALNVTLPGESFKVVANLPFDGATAILRRLLEPHSALTTADVIVDWGLASKRAAVWPGTRLSAYWGAWFDLSIARRLPRSVFAPPPSVDAAVLRVVRRVRPLVPVAECVAYDRFLGRGYGGGVGSVVTARQFKRCEAELGLARHASPRDLDAAQWAGLWRAVRQSV